MVKSAVSSAAKVVRHVMLMTAVLPVLIAVDLEGLPAIRAHLGVDRLGILFLQHSVDLPIHASALLTAEPLLSSLVMFILCNGLSAESTSLPVLDLCRQVLIDRRVIAIKLPHLIPNLLVRSSGVFRNLPIAHAALSNQDHLLHFFFCLIVLLRGYSLFALRS